MATNVQLLELYVYVIGLINGIKCSLLGLLSLDFA